MHTDRTDARRLTRPALALAAALLLLTGCASTTAQPDPHGSPAHAPSSAGEAVTVDDAWVKSAAEGMTAGFGILSNPTDDEITVVSARTDAATGVELHETVADSASGGTTMREVRGGFVIPAGGTLELAPGGEHLMLMGLTAPIEAGQEVQFTLTFSDESTMSFAAPVKDFTGAQEHYESEHEEHDAHSEHDSDQGH